MDKPDRAFGYVDDLRVEGRPQVVGRASGRARDRLDRRASEQSRHGEGVAGRGRQLRYRVGQQKAQIGRHRQRLAWLGWRVSSCECARELECEERIPAACVVNASEKVAREPEIGAREQKAP